MAEAPEKTTEAKPLEKMTVKELRKLALELGGITGVHVMKKDELLAAVKASKGIVDESTRGYRSDITSRLKAEIRRLRGLKEEARQAGDKKRVKILQRKINRLRKKTRRAA